MRHVKEVWGRSALKVNRSVGNTNNEITRPRVPAPLQDPVGPESPPHYKTLYSCSDSTVTGALVLFWAGTTLLWSSL